MNSFKSHNQNLIGVGLRSEHYPILENQKPKEIDWFEAISENYMNTQGRPLKMLLNLRENYPIALHGVGMSVASHEGVSQIYLKKLKDLVQTIQPLIVSDHLCWSQKAGHYSHDLLPFPLTEESLNLIVQNIQQVQDQLGRPICLENISYYLTSKEDQMSEVSFINEVCSRSGCGLLLDLNNIEVNAQNHGFKAKDFLSELKLEPVQQIHLAGPSNEEGFVFDTHSTPVPDSVWELYKEFCRRKKNVPVIIEWDDKIPAFQVLAQEAVKAREFFL